jgi:hypothetical protein
VDQDRLSACQLAPSRIRAPGLLTRCEIWCDMENSKSFRSSCDHRIFPGHRLKSAPALHNFLALIFTAPNMMTWSDMSGNTRKNQVTRLVTVRHRSIVSGALSPCLARGAQGEDVPTQPPGQKTPVPGWRKGSTGCPPRSARGSPSYIESAVSGKFSAKLSICFAIECHRRGCVRRVRHSLDAWDLTHLRVPELAGCGPVGIQAGV